MIRHLDYRTRADDLWRVQDKPGARRYGFEIETGWGESDQRDDFFGALEARHLDKYVMSKNDSTIRGVPAEIVSRPLVFLECKRVAKRVLDCALQTHGLTLSGCGVHVHTTRDAWPKAALVYAKMATEGAGATERFWDALATRTANQWCERRGTELSGVVVAAAAGDPYYVRAAASADSLCGYWANSGSHYDAVSWSMGQPTIEFRLFGATRQVRTLASYLDTVQALLEYGIEQTACSTNPAEWPKFDPCAFIRWVLAKPGWQALKWRFKHSAGLRGFIRRSCTRTGRTRRERVRDERAQVVSETRPCPYDAVECPHGSCSVTCARCIQSRRH